MGTESNKFLNTKMNPTIYKQLDSRWSSKPYPTYSSSFGGNGCGCCACVHVAIEQESKQNWTPESLRPWMVNQGYAVAGKGTLWQGIYDTLKYIGHDSVVWIHEADPMSKAWAELDKGNRIGVLLVDNGSTPDGTYWTSSGHFVMFTKYWKDSSGNHWFNIKDSGGRNHDGDFCYERSIKHALPQLFIVERIGKEPTPTPPQPEGKIAVDGDGGYHTIKRLQEFFGLSDPDGLIGRQRKEMVSKYVPSLSAVSYSTSGGSNTVTALQKWLGLSGPDGLWGKNTSGALQRKLRDLGYLAADESIDSIFGPKSMKALQTALNNDFKPIRPVDPLQKWYDAMTDQYNWSKNQDYDWVTPTIESSKSKGTCITFPACSLQRLGMLPSGGYFYYYPDGQYLFCKPNGWLSDHSEWFSVSYPNKTIPELWRLGQIQKGDFVGFDNPAYHSMVFMGMNSSGQPIFNTMGHTKGLGITYSTYANRKVAVIVRLKKVK